MPGFKAQIALLYHLDVIVKEAQQEVPQGDEKRQQHLRRPGCHIEGAQGQPQDNHDAPHGGSAALGLMALGPLLADALPKLQLMELRDKKGPGNEYKAGSDKSCHQQAEFH